MIAELELQIIAALQIVFDRFCLLTVAAMTALEGATGLMPSEINLGLAGWILLDAHGAPPSMVFVGGLYASLGSAAGCAFARPDR